MKRGDFQAWTLETGDHYPIVGVSTNNTTLGGHTNDGVGEKVFKLTGRKNPAGLDTYYFNLPIKSLTEKYCSLNNSEPVKLR